MDTTSPDIAVPRADQSLAPSETVRRTSSRRRPSGEPPPLPRHLERTGVGWLAASLVLVAGVVLAFGLGRRGVGAAITVVDDRLVHGVVSLRTPGLTSVMRLLARLGTWGVLHAIAWPTLVALLFFKRFRHLFVFVAAANVMNLMVVGLAELASRPRPFGVAILTGWSGYAMPSVVVASLATTLTGVLYTLVPEGPWRQRGKWIATCLVALLGAARIYLGADAASDVLVGGVLGVTVPLLAFRILTPNLVFPVTYRRGRTAHLDLGGRRGEAIHQALADQLGIIPESIEPFGLAGSAGSTPLRICVSGDPNTYLFGKLYAKSHLRSDRWYKLGRELLYGRLEDEKPFNTVRRLVQQEDYALRLMRDHGLPSAEPFGFVEITPEREYLLVTEFFDGATELGEAEVDDGIIRDGLEIIRKLWDAGLAHRDIKPANLLVRDRKLYLIDVFFAEVRPTPWRQAVDLANMMLVLALRSDPARVYEQAKHLFTVEDITEAFAAARGLAMPSQLRRMMRAQGRDLHAEFVKLLPERPRPISIQRWSPRRVALALSVVVAALVLVGNPSLFVNDVLGANSPVLTNNVDCARPAPLTLMAQSVPSASLIPCVTGLPAGWSVNGVTIEGGRSVLNLNNDRAGVHALVVTFARTCPVAGALSVPSDEPGAVRYEQVQRLRPQFEELRSYVFPGGCAAFQFKAATAARSQVTNEASLAFTFISRDSLRALVRERSHGRLQLDPSA